MKSQQFKVTLTGLTDLLMHNDDPDFKESLDKWRKDPANKSMSINGDDRSPAWTWMGYLYSSVEEPFYVGIPSDNLMTMLRQAGSKIQYKGQETYKRQTQAGIMVDQDQFDLYTYKGTRVSYRDIYENLMGVSDPQRFKEHQEYALDNGFELFRKNATVMNKKHMRVRPRFRDWTAVGMITLIDPEQTGLNQSVLQKILNQGGTMVGLGDWRPSANLCPGSFGKFEAHIEKM